ncbi:YjdF family protein [Clostridium formicaceticum]|uniref:DUF2992 domain-containing protein n=1 Tax=Clostridium formicaceticum TaxID=1497 RepID=A0AAC9WGX2_9CLOT|nr:YjdF family protein [Clostridium formicaceticum]AOY77851.1 hypothetical protein BJL90_19495 [Clostridium formicaceticum]ARE88467.1 hypothetical protein CLFO_28700 [Clostridium formicaceticum]
MKSYELKTKLTIFFEEPYWKGVFERFNNGKYEVSKIIFGCEPKNYDVYDFILKNYYSLKFSEPMLCNDKYEEKKVNPKRLQRKIRNELQNEGIGTKAQQAIKLQIEKNKTKGKHELKKKQEEEKRRKFELKQQKKKAKHKGH